MLTYEEAKVTILAHFRAQELEKSDYNQNKTKNYSKKVIRPSKEETESHKNFIKHVLKKNFY